MELRDLKGPPEAHNVERIAYLFRQVPPMIGASLIGIFLVFVFLFESVGADPLKAWAAYMLSVLGIGVWLWSMHRNAAVTPLTVRRWEYAIIMDNLRRRVQSENPLSEQQAIFQSISQGIALVSGGHIVKCNQRLGEILGRRLQDLYALGFAEHFVDRAEFERTVAESTEAFSRNRNYLGMVRLRRADGSEFRAELSGRRMHGADDGRSVWLIGDITPAQAAGQPRY